VFRRRTEIAGAIRTPSQPRQGDDAARVGGGSWQMIGEQAIMLI